MREKVNIPGEVRALPPFWKGRPLVYSLALVQLVLLVGLAIWDFRDPRLEFLGIAQAFLASGELSNPEIGALRVMFGLALVCLVVHFSTFVWALPSIRSLKYVAIVMAIFAGHLSVLTSWQQLSWMGRKSRIAPAIASLEPIADKLNRAWPMEDGKDSIFGPYMAYPTFRPSILVLLTPHQVMKGTYIAEIDRGDNGILRFQLSDGFESIWLERHQADSLPEKFTSGLDQPYRPDRQIAVAPGWYLVRYDEDPPSALGPPFAYPEKRSNHEIQ